MSRAIQLARTVLIQAFIEDPSFRHTYVANIAMCLHDEQSEGEATDFRNQATRERYAERIMNHVFPTSEVKTEPYNQVPLPFVDDRCGLLRAAEDCYAALCEGDVGVLTATGVEEEKKHMLILIDYLGGKRDEDIADTEPPSAPEA